MSAPARAPVSSPLVSTAWLADHLGRRNVRVVDGSWHMPQLNRDARAEFTEAHIPGAVFCDIDAIADRGSPLPHMLPRAPEFAREVGAPSTSGALIARMTRDSEAYDAGIRPGDVVVAFNGQPIIEPSQFLRMVADARVGSTATVSVLREGRRMEFRLPIVSSSRARRSPTEGHPKARRRGPR